MNQNGTKARRAVAGVAVLGAAALLAASCSKAADTNDAGAAPAATSPTAEKLGGTIAGPPDSPTATNGGRVVFGIEAEPEGLDPARYAFSSSGNTVASAVFDPLATLDANGNGIPYLATAIDGTDNNKTWTITLPTGVKFHDGTDFNAKAAAAALESYRDSYVTKLSLQKVTSIEATDDTHVVVKLSQPMRAFPALLSTQVGYMFAPAMATNPDLVNKPVGTGPYVFDSHDPGKIWSFKKNPTYWRKGLPHLDAIDFKPTPDEGQRVKGLRTGDMDLVHTRWGASVNDLRAAADVKRVENSAGEEDYLILNTEKPPFNSLTARQAVAAAADVGRWQKEQMAGVEQPATSPFAKGQPGYLDDNGYPTFDMAKAKQLVAQYTAETGQPLEFGWVTQDDVNVRSESQFFSQLFEQAGMKVSVTALPQINLVARVATGDYEMGRFRLFSAADPDVDAAFWRSTSVLPAPNVSLNFPRYQNPQVDAAIDAALESNDENVRNQSYQTVSKLFAQNLPYIWMGRPVWVLAANPRVNGIYPAANGSVQTIGAKTWLAELFLTK